MSDRTGRGTLRLRRVMIAAAIVSVATIATSAEGGPPAGAGWAVQTPTGPWIRPVPGVVTRSFEAPSGPFAPGHRGVDFAVAPGAPVRVAGPGIVVFAGAVGGALHVVVAHARGYRTGYSYLRRVEVRVGDRLAVGSVVGVAGGVGGPGDPHHGGVLHWSLRVDGRYVDPMRLLGVPELWRIVFLDRLQREAARFRTQSVFGTWLLRRV